MNQIATTSILPNQEWIFIAIIYRTANLRSALVLGAPSSIHSRTPRIYLAKSSTICWETMAKIMGAKVLCVKMYLIGPGGADPGPDSREYHPGVGPGLAPSGPTAKLAKRNYAYVNLWPATRMGVPQSCSRIARIARKMFAVESN